MATLEVKGINEMLLFLDIAESRAKKHIGRSIYPGAKYVMTIVMEEMQRIQVDDSRFWQFPYRLGPTSVQKEWIILGAGIAKLKEKKSGYDVKIGYDGYMPVKSTVSKKGLQPIALIARSVNKGTSFMRAQPFMDIAMRRAERPAIEIMDKALNEELEKEWDRYGPR